MVFAVVARRLIRREAPAEGEKRKCFGLTLRQWALLHSMLIFIITTVITICAILGYVHSKEANEILNEDIREEMETTHDVLSGQFTSNQAVLYLSIDKVIMTNRIMAACMWGSLINLLSAGLVMYGVAMRSSRCIIPWLVISVISYIVAVIALILGHLHVLPSVYVTTKILSITFSCGTLFSIMWYCIWRYYSALNPKTPTPTTVYQTREGYSHTVTARSQVVPRV